MKWRFKMTEEEIERYYASLNKDILDYILKFREKDPNEPLIQIISHYCFEKDLEPELVGYSISRDYYFTQYIENDCKAFPEYSLIPTNALRLEEW